MSDLSIPDVNVTKRIKALLALRGETTVDLANRLGVRQPTLSFRLTARREWHNRCSIPRVAAALGVPETTITHGRPWPDVRGHS